MPAIRRLMTVAAGVIFVAASLPGPGFTSERETAQLGVKRLLRSLQDPSPETRRQATDTVRTLGSQADPRLIMALATLVREDPDEKVVSGAVLALAETGGQNRAMAVQALQKSFVRNDIGLLCGKCYLDAFRQLQAPDAVQECVPALLDAAAASDRSIQERAIGKLLDVGPELPESAISEITARLRAPGAPDRLWYVLMQAAPTHPDLVTRELIALVLQGRGRRSGLGIPDWEPATIVRKAGPGALPAITAARPALVAAIQEGPAGVPYHAARLLGLLGPESLNDLTLLASSTRRETREAAIEVIAGIGEAVVPSLMEALSADEAQQGAAVRTLAQIRPSTTVVKATTRALADPRPRVREAAARILGLIGAESRAASPELLSALDSEKDAAALASVARAAGKIGIDAAVPKLLALVRSHAAVAVRSAAAGALGEIDPVAPATVSALIEATADKAVSSSASSALREAGLAALPGLVRAMLHPNADVRWSAIYNIGEISGYYLPGLFRSAKETGGIENVVKVIETISDTVIPGLAECTESGCPDAARDLRNAIGGFREGVLYQIDDWPPKYEDLDYRQMDVLEKTVVATARAADSISRVLTSGFPHGREGEDIAQEIAAGREEFLSLATALLKKYGQEALAEKVLNSGISGQTLADLGF